MGTALGFHGSGKWVHFTAEDVWLETERGYHKYFIRPPKPPRKRVDKNSAEAVAQRKEVRLERVERARRWAEKTVYHERELKLQREAAREARYQADLSKERKIIVRSLALAAQGDLLDQRNLAKALDFEELLTCAGRAFDSNELKYRESYRAYLADHNRLDK